MAKTITRIKYGAGGYRKKRYMVKQRGAGKRLDEVKRRATQAVGTAKKWLPVVMPILAGIATTLAHQQLQQRRRGRFSGFDELDVSPSDVSGIVSGLNEGLRREKEKFGLGVIPPQKQRATPPRPRSDVKRVKVRSNQSVALGLGRPRGAPTPISAESRRKERLRSINKAISGTGKKKGGVVMSGGRVGRLV